MGRVVDVLIDSQAQPQALVVDLSDSLAGDKRQVAANWADLHVVSRNKAMQLQLDFTDAQIKAVTHVLDPINRSRSFRPVVPATGTCDAARYGSAPRPRPRLRPRRRDRRRAPGAAKRSGGRCARPSDNDNEDDLKQW